MGTAESTAADFSGYEAANTSATAARHHQQPARSRQQRQHVAASAKQAADRWRTPYPWLPGLRTWSSGVVPPILGVVLVFLVSLPKGAHALLPLLMCYFGGGAIYGLALYAVPSLDSWAKVLLGGGMLYGLATLWLLGNPILFVLGCLLCLALGYGYLRHYRCMVPADTIYITTLAGRYWRTIVSGNAWLVPGERVQAKIANPLRVYTVPLRRAYPCAPTGEYFVAEAGVSVSYRQTATDALHPKIPLAQREAQFRQLVCKLLDSSLEACGRVALKKRRTVYHTARPINGRRLARVLLRQLRRQAHQQRFAVGTVRIRDVRLASSPHGVGSVSQRSSAHEIHASWPTEKPTDRRTNQHASQQQQQIERHEAHKTSSATDVPEAYRALPLAVLLNLYRDVHANRISDPATIYAIAQAFQIVAEAETTTEADEAEQDAVTSPYDLKRAAQFLLAHAAILSHSTTRATCESATE